MKAYKVFNMETTHDHPVIYRTDSNHPGQVTSYPAVRPAEYEIVKVIWCRVQGVPVGVVR